MASSNPNSPRDTPQSPTQRRSSFVDMFNPRSSMSSQNSSSRRLSLTTLGLSTLPQAQATPFSAMRARAESTSSANSNSVDESPFEDDAASASPGSMSTSMPPTPFARRMSIGAQRALRGAAAGGGGGAVGGSSSTNGSSSNNTNGRSPVPSTGFANNTSYNTTKASASSPGSKSREGYDFAEKLRARAERASVSNGLAGSAYNQSPSSQPHHRSKSVAVMEPPKVEPARQQRPDAFQERILKGDFYMD